MVSSIRPRHSFSDYLEIEERSPAVKFEFHEGQILAMAGGTPEHAAVAMTIGALLHRQLEGRTCRVFSSDLRIRVRATGLATYPDVSVVCGKLETDPEDPTGRTVTNPIVLVEVLSKTTEDYDRGEKLAHYKRIESLREILLIAHDEHRIERWHREGDRWTVDVAHAGGTVAIGALGATLALDDVYRDPLAG